MGDAVGCGEGIGVAEVVAGVAAGNDLAELVVCAAAIAVAPHRKIAARIPESWRS